EQEREEEEKEENGQDWKGETDAGRLVLVLSTLVFREDIPAGVKGKRGRDTGGESVWEVRNQPEEDLSGLWAEATGRRSLDRVSAVRTVGCHLVRDLSPEGCSQEWISGSQ
ncbi:MAG: hypothetical protein AAF203_02400, partial [Pseudomonadota bacterium]